MIITSFKYSYYNLNFANPFKYSKNIFYNREGFILQITSASGQTALGECSPLPGFSYEEISESDQQLQKLSQILYNFEIGNNLDSLENFTAKRNLFPSVKFGLEQCFLNLFAVSSNNFLSANFGIKKKEIPVNAVVSIGEKLDIISEIERKSKAGFNTFKIKLGGVSLDTDINLIESIRKFFGNEINIRLDLNGAWDKKIALSNIEKFLPFGIQYIEEPCGFIDSLTDIAKKSRVPIAVDESMNSVSDLLNVIKSSNIQHIVLKPMITTGIFSAIKLIEEANRRNKKIILSSSFESAVGKSALVFLASLVKHNLAHGLDTGSHFKTDICADPFNSGSGKILFDPAAYPPKINLLIK